MTKKKMSVTKKKTLTITKRERVRHQQHASKAKTGSCYATKNDRQKEPGVEKLATFVSKKLKISTPAFKPFSMKMLDGYMIKPYCQKYTDFVEVDVHVAGVLKEHGTRWG